jgi:pimeloyl-ACP methyl ester carboxylesterase
MEIQKYHTRIPIDAGQSLHAFVMRPTQESARNLVFVFSHGFTVDGVESARHFLTIAYALIEYGCSTILFDYRGSGYSDREFEDMTLDTEIADLNAVIDFARNEFPGYEIGAWGESLGTAVIAHTLAHRSDVALVLLWSLSADLHRRYQEKLGKDVDRQGYAYSANGFKVNSGFLDSLQGRDTFAAIEQMGVPCLLVHGDADPVAAVELSREAHRMASNTALHEVNGGNHGFESQPPQFTEALDVSMNWIRANSSFSVGA